MTRVNDSIKLAVFDIVWPTIDSVGVAKKNIESENVFEFENGNDCVNVSDWVNIPVSVGENDSLMEKESEFEKINENENTFNLVKKLVGVDVGVSLGVKVDEFVKK